MSSLAMPQTAALVTGLYCAYKAGKLPRIFNRMNIFCQRKQDDGPISSGAPKRRATLDQETDLFKDGLVVKPIGVVKSIYRLCVGTPRQGLLAPHARGRIEIATESDAVAGLEGYSHVWIVFVFHLNTVSKKSGSNNKVAPPALGGKKVGVLATRSPHRPNPIGITLCKLDSITLPNKLCKKTYLEISGLDLVDGTPVLDVKPYVPHYDSVDTPQLPLWVSNGLSTRRKVVISTQAKQELETLLTNDPNCLELYGQHRGDVSIDATIENVTHCIEEVLGYDVRSAFQTSKVRKNKFQAERAERMQDVLGNHDKSSSATSADKKELLCTQQLDNLLLHYAAVEPNQHNRSTSQGSGAEDVVTVHSIQLLVSGKIQSVPKESKSTIAVEIIEDKEINSSEMKSPDQSPDSNKVEQPMNERVVEETILEGANSQDDTVIVSDAIPKTVPSQSDEGVIVSPLQSPEKRKSTLPYLSQDKAAEGSTPTSPSTPKKYASSYAMLELDNEDKEITPALDADYKSLQSYWDTAASMRTPTGVVPEKEEVFRKRHSEKFVFAERSSSYGSLSSKSQISSKNEID